MVWKESHPGCALKCTETEVSSRKRSMAVFTDLQMQALQAGYGQAADDIAEKEVRIVCVCACVRFSACG